MNNLDKLNTAISALTAGKQLSTDIGKKTDAGEPTGEAYTCQTARDLTKDVTESLLQEGVVGGTTTVLTGSAAAAAEVAAGAAALNPLLLAVVPGVALAAPYAYKNASTIAGYAGDMAESICHTAFHALGNSNNGSSSSQDVGGKNSCSRDDDLDSLLAGLSIKSGVACEANPKPFQYIPYGGGSTATQNDAVLSDFLGQLEKDARPPAYQPYRTGLAEPSRSPSPGNQTNTLSSTNQFRGDSPPNVASGNPPLYNLPDSDDGYLQGTKVNDNQGIGLRARSPIPENYSPPPFELPDSLSNRNSPDRANLIGNLSPSLLELLQPISGVGFDLGDDEGNISSLAFQGDSSNNNNAPEWPDLSARDNLSPFMFQNGTANDDVDWGANYPGNTSSFAFQDNSINAIAWNNQGDDNSPFDPFA